MDLKLYSTSHLKWLRAHYNKTIKESQTSQWLSPMAKAARVKVVLIKEELKRRLK